MHLAVCKSKNNAKDIRVNLMKANVACYFENSFKPQQNEWKLN